MSSPTPYAIRLKTPVPVIVHGQVPVTAHSALPVVEQHWPPPNIYEQYGFLISVVAALAAIGAAIFAGLTFKVAQRELEVVEKELNIIAKEARLTLSATDGSDSVSVPFNPQMQSNGRGGEIPKSALAFNVRIENIQNGSVPDALLYFWLPAGLEPTFGHLRKSDVKVLNGVKCSLITSSIRGRIYPAPYRTEEHLTFWAVTENYNGYWPPPKPSGFDLYWQIVCEHGTFPSAENPAPFHIRFGESVNRPKDGRD